MKIPKIVSIVLLSVHLILCQQLDADLSNPNAKLVPQVSETRCTYDTDCSQPNSYCKGNDAAGKKTGYCACKEDHFIVTEAKAFQCLPFVEGFGSPCLVDRQCVTALGSNFAYCDDLDGCQCDDGYHFHQNRCYKISGINDICQSSKNCLINELGPGLAPRTGFAHCVEGRCTCGMNKHHVKESDTCIESVAIGGSCKSDDECNTVGEWGVCDIVCVCRAGWVVEDRGLTCLKAANEVGDRCTQLSQCTIYLGADSLCDLSTGTCQCKEHAYPMGAHCYQRRFLGDACTHSAQCKADGQVHGDCVGGECQCVRGTEQRGSRCLRDGEADRNGAGAGGIARRWGVVVMVWVHAAAAVARIMMSSD